jgi:hypothetical protein
MAIKIIDYSDVIQSLTFSFHGGNKEVYEASMGLNFDITKGNIVGFMGMEHNIESHICCIHRSNISPSEAEFVKMWSGIRFSSVSIRPSCNWMGDKPDDMVLDIGKKIPCSRILRQLDVQFDGYVPLCCLDGHGRIIFGDLKYMTIKEIWANKLREHYRRMHMENRYDELPYCSQCGVNIV